MGYEAYATGEFALDCPLSAKTLKMLNEAANTERRWDKIHIHFIPKEEQPGVYLDWMPNEDGTAIIANNTNSLSGYNAEWLVLLIKYVFAPRGYVLNGEVNMEDSEGNYWILGIENNEVYIRLGYIEYEEARRPVTLN